MKTCSMYNHEMKCYIDVYEVLDIGLIWDLNNPGVWG